jgi:hypothetical protein
VPGDTPGAYVPYEQLSRPLNERVGFVWERMCDRDVTYDSVDHLIEACEAIAKSDLGRSDSILEAVIVECDIVTGDTTISLRTFLERTKR